MIRSLGCQLNLPNPQRFQSQGMRARIRRCVFTVGSGRVQLSSRRVIKAMESKESPVDKQVRLLKPMLDYCDVRELEIRCGSADEAEAVGRAAVADLAGSLQF